MSIPPQQTARALNSMVVGLCCKGKEALPACLGLGIVRSVDSQRGLIYVLTDLLPDALEAVDLLQVHKLV